MKTKRTGKYPSFEELVQLAKSAPIPRQTNKEDFINRAEEIPQNKISYDVDKLYVSNYAESLAKFSFKDLSY